MDTGDFTTILHRPKALEGIEAKRRARLIPESSEFPEFALDEPEAVLGRGKDASFCIKDTRVSRHHARLLAVHNLFYVQDLESTNGTYLNGNRVRFERLADGDSIQFGGPAFRFEISRETDDGYLRKLNLETVKSLALAVEAKDPYTRGHSDRVARVAEKLANALGLDRQEAERIRLAGQLHDIGKIGVPEAVLLKKARLTDEEFAAIKKHPEAGEAILSPLAFLSDILPAVRYHHERFDGRGYPDGLSGDALPLKARIVQVADTFDAITSNRPYRQALDHDYVLQEFKTHAGTQFDPEVAAAFRSLLPTLA